MRPCSSSTRNPCPHATCQAVSAVSPRTPDRLDGVKGRFEHCRFIDVGRRQQDRERDSLPVDHKMALRALLPRSVGFFPVFSPPRERPPWRRRLKLGSSRCGRLGRVDPTRLVETVPDASRVPVPETAPAGHSRTAAHLAWQHLPRCAGHQDEEDARQNRSIREGRPPPFGDEVSEGATGVR